MTTASSSRAAAAFTYAGLGVGAVFAALPVLWGVSTSLKSVIDVNAFPSEWIPETVTFGNWVTAVFSGRYSHYLVNTVIVIAFTLVLSLGLAAHAAHATVRHAFAGRKLTLNLMWATVMIPGIAIIVPLYSLAVHLGIYDTLIVLVLVYSAWLVPTLIWLLRGFVASIPNELEEAARVDGCSRLGAFYRVTLPLLRPGLLAGGVLVFIHIWNEFLVGYSLVLSDQHRLIQVGVYFFVTENGIAWGPLTAAATASVIPVVLAYAFLQRSFIQGLTSGAVKG
ncbi:MAG TPA: carbohydrate ABC transporter permease [Bauldia sp.]|nr:carbohydrate ABC transporter permease [Bauldia sp.]